MKRVCCVYKKYLGETEGPKDMVTHGFCETCLEIYMAEMDADFKEIDKAEIEKKGLPRRSRRRRRECCG